MRNRFREVTALVAAAVPLACLAACQRGEPFLPEHPVIDLLVEDGTVIDGRGGPRFAADIAGVDGTIVFVGDAAFAPAELAERVRGIDSDNSPTGSHPRGHGTCARIIEAYVMESKLLTLEEAVRRMNSYAASLLGIPDRGVPAPGMKADLLVFDPARAAAGAAS